VIDFGLRRLVLVATAYISVQLGVVALLVIESNGGYWDDLTALYPLVLVFVLAHLLYFVRTVAKWEADQQRPGGS
jgi:hypothetical protein